MSPDHKDELETGFFETQNTSVLGGVDGRRHPVISVLTTSGSLSPAENGPCSAAIGPDDPPTEAPQTTRLAETQSVSWVRSPSNRLTFSSVLKARAAKTRGYVRFDHVIVGGVEDVASDDPHDALVHHRLVGSSGQASICELLTGPEGGVGGNRDGAVQT